MKKFVFVLVAALLLTLAACGGQTEQPPTITGPVFEAVEPGKNGSDVYQLTEPGHLMYMAANPDKAYALAADIDMGGAVWTPVDDFSGSLTGLIYGEFNYTISNLVIQAKESDGNVGIFRTLSGKVEDVIFRDITVICSGNFLGNVGVVAGVAKSAMSDVEVKDCSVEATLKDANAGLLCGKAEKDVTDCYAAGQLNVKLAKGSSYVGGAIGCSAANVINCESRTDISVNGTGNTGAVGGVVGYNGGITRSASYGGALTVAADSSFGAGTLVGELASGGVAASYNCATAVSVTKARQDSEYCGKQAAGAVVNTCLTRDMNYTEAKLSSQELALRQQVVQYMYDMCTVRWSPAETISYSDGCYSGTEHDQTYFKGKIYFGPPYTHRTSSFEKFLYYLSEDGVISEEITSANINMIGNDCADAVYWAWSQISSQIKFVQTHSAICINGTIPVGNYQVANNEATKDTCKLNGAQVMYEAYACVQPGDALLYGPGHIRLAAEAAYVFRNADGSIDPNKSYILTHEQGAGCGKLQESHSTCLVNGKYTFEDLFKTNYIPITIEAFANGKADEIVATTSNKDLTKTGLAAGTITSNYRINYVTVEIIDADGKVLLDAFGSPNINDTHITTFDLSEFKSRVDALSLTSGQTYTYKVTLCVASQEVPIQTFQFTA